MSFIQAMDTYKASQEMFASPKQKPRMQLGENGHAEYSTSTNVSELIVQFYFQLVSTKNTANLEKMLHTILTTLTKKYIHSAEMKAEAIEELTLMYKMIGNTRDIIDGKGIYHLTYMQIYIWHSYCPELAKYAVDTLTNLEDTTTTKETHPYGSWKDIKYLCQYVKDKSGDDKHPLILHCIYNMIDALRNDYYAFEQNKPVSLAAKWCPREKGKYSWIFKEIVYHSYKYYFEFATSKKARIQAYRKACRQCRQSLSMLNSYIDTTQVKMCGQEWAKIDFNAVTSITMRKNNNAFANKKTIRQKEVVRHQFSTDRIQCAKNLSDHVEEARINSLKTDDDETKTKATIHGKRVGVYELVRDAMKFVKRGYTGSGARSQERDTNDAYKIVNLQWKDNAPQNKPLGNMIPMADTSASMNIDNFTPLYNSIGLSIRLSELAAPEFRDRVLTFSARPEWVLLDKCQDFVHKVEKLSNTEWGLHTNFYAAVSLILQVIIANDMPPEKVEDLALVVFSDMQIDEAMTSDTYKSKQKQSMYDTIKQLYHSAGMKTKYKRPYNPPHIVFWNLRSTTGYPTISTTKNVTMLSGYSPVLLNAFYNKGMEAIREYNPYSMICNEILSLPRYEPMENKIRSVL